MMFEDIDKKFRRSIEEVAEDLKGVYNDYLEAYKNSASLSLDKNEITRAVILRLQAWYTTQKQMKEFLRKRYIMAGADFFVETILFFLKTMIEIYNLKVIVCSERQIKQLKGSPRPDISIWNPEEDALLCAIECKTQLGWNRDRWESDFRQRERRLKESFPNVEVFLLVMTEENWGGFGENENIGKKYFAVLKKDEGEGWPQSVTEENLDDKIWTFREANTKKYPIDSLFLRITEIVRKN